MSFEEETGISSRAVSPNIYRRQVPGISNGQLASAISADQQRQRDEPTINTAFTQTSPSLYYHQQAGQQRQAVQQQALSQGFSQEQAFPSQPIARWGSSSEPIASSVLPDADDDQASTADAPLTVDQASALIANQSRINASLARLESNGQQRQQERQQQETIVEPLEQQIGALKNSVSTLTWLLVAFGIVLLTLLVVVVVMVSRAYSIACTNQTGASAQPPLQQQSAAQPTLSSSTDSLFR